MTGAKTGKSDREDIPMMRITTFILMRNVYAFFAGAFLVAAIYETSTLWWVCAILSGIAYLADCINRYIQFGRHLRAIENLGIERELAAMPPDSPGFILECPERPTTERRLA